MNPNRPSRSRLGENPTVGRRVFENSEKLNSFGSRRSTKPASQLKHNNRGKSGFDNELMEYFDDDYSDIDYLVSSRNIERSSDDWGGRY